MRDSSKRQADVGVEELEQDTNDGSDEAAALGGGAGVVAESQGEQAPGLSGVDVTKVHNPAHTTSVRVTAGSRGSSIMDTTSECPVTGACYDFSELGDKSCHLQNVFRKTVLVVHFTTVHSPLKVNVPQCQAHKSIREQIANKAQRHLEFICKLIMIQHRDGRYFIHEHPGGISS